MVWLAITFGAAWVGVRCLPDTWYQRLNKPPWNWRNWLFASVWPVLYLLMGVAPWLEWRRYGLSRTKAPLRLYVLPLALNAASTWLFLGRHQPREALLESARCGW